MDFWMNFLFIPLWHYLALVIIARIDHKFFYIECDKSDALSLKKKKNKYEKILKIKMWKDLVPQYVGKSGFSKKNMVSLKLEYIKRFIAETYRAEVDHIVCCFIIPFIFLLNSFKVSAIFSIIICISNIPCILIQRYNRLRLRQLVLKFKKINANEISET